MTAGSRRVIAFACGVGLLLSPTLAAADDCSDGFVAKISTAHRYIETGTGDIYRFQPEQADIVAHSFAVMDDISICPHTTFGVATWTIQDKNSLMTVAVDYVCNATNGTCN